jgi:O-succinylbenzoic acid--CoA ligase
LPKEKTLCHLQCALLGGASFSQALLEEAIKRGIPLFTTYGMTEMSSIITAAKLPTSVHAGMPLAFRDCRLSADKEILVKGVPLFSGYWDADAKTLTLPCVEEAWFATRDCGEFTQEGNLRITGRKDRLFISGGENIQPEEIEKALCRIPGITFAVVVPIPDSEFGHRPIAYICDETNSHTLDSVREALSPLLPSFKHPINIFPYVTKGSFKTCE